MAEYTREIEVERIMNVVRGFGWEKIKEEMIGDEIHITLKKKIAVHVPTEEPAE